MRREKLFIRFPAIVEPKISDVRHQDNGVLRLRGQGQSQSCCCLKYYQLLSKFLPSDITERIGLSLGELSTSYMGSAKHEKLPDASDVPVPVTSECDNYRLEHRGFEKLLISSN